MQQKATELKQKVDHWIDFLEDMRHFPLARDARKDLEEIRIFLEGVAEGQRHHE